MNLREVLAQALMITHQRLPGVVTRRSMAPNKTQSADPETFSVMTGVAWRLRRLAAVERGNPAPIAGHRLGHFHSEIPVLATEDIGSKKECH